MNTILHIDSSIFGAKGESSQLSQTVVNQLRTLNPNASVTRRDLSNAPIPHFDASTIEQISANEAVLADELIHELREADTLVLSAPMYNFSVPSQLKAWFDHITRAGVTFRYTENGPVGLLGEKRVFVIATSGGHHKDSKRDAVEPWLRTILNFLGLDTDLHFIHAGGLAISDAKQQSRDNAKAQIIELINSITSEEGVS